MFSQQQHLNISLPSKAKCHIALCSNNTINCGVVEVNQKDLTRGCERKITSISKEDVDKYSEPRFSGDRNKDLTLWVYLTMQ